MASFWTDDRDATLTRLWSDDGLSADQIARRMGAVSRSAVIGRAHRLGLPKRTIGSRKLTAASSVRAPRVRKAPDAVKKLELHAAMTDVATKTLTELEPNDCRWPVGDPVSPTFGFCGCPRMSPLPYCEAHVRRAYDTGQVQRLIARATAENKAVREFAS